MLEPEVDWGNLVNNTWIGMIGKVVEGKADVGLAAFSLSPERLSYINYLAPILRSK